MVLAVPHHHHHPTTAAGVPPYDEDGGDRAPLLMMSSSKSYTRALSCDRLRKVEEWVWSLQKTNTNKNSTKPNKKTETATDFLSGGGGDDESSSESSSPLIDLIDLVNSTKPRSTPPPPCLLPRNNRVQPQQHNKTSSSSPLLLSPLRPPPRPPVVVVEEDVDVGQCGWFWGTSASMESLHSLLSSCGIGTFLLRSSSHPLYRYTLSVQTSRGPTSVRIVRSATTTQSSSPSVYSLDSADSRLPLPRFPSVVALVQYYVNEHHHHQSSQKKKKVKLTTPTPPPDQQQQQQQVVWVESGSGRTHSRVVLSQPLLTNPHSLKHAARLAVNRLQQQQSSSLNSSFTIPTSLVKYIHTYPFTI